MSDVNPLDKYTDEGAENQPERPCIPNCDYVIGLEKGWPELYHAGHCPNHNPNICVPCIRMKVRAKNG